MSTTRTAVVFTLSAVSAASLTLSVSAVREAREAREELRVLRERQRDDHNQAMGFVKSVYDVQHGTDSTYDARK